MKSPLPVLNSSPHGVRIEYSHVLTRQDVLDAQRPQLHQRAIRHAILWITVFFVTFLVVLSLDARRLETGPTLMFALGAVVLGMPVLYLCFIALFSFLFNKRASAHFKGDAGVYHVVLDADGVHLTSDGGVVDTPWTAYSGWRETSKVVFLLRDGKVDSFLPKGAWTAHELSVARSLAHAMGVPGCRPA